MLIAVGRRDVLSVNHIDGRTGTLRDGRYKSSLLQAEIYLLLCHPYVELNPVRAGLVADLGLHRWSGDRANALGEAEKLVTPQALYLGLGDDEEVRRAAYRELFRIALDARPLGALRLALNQDQPVGNDRFYREIEAMTGQRRELRKRGRPRKQDEPPSADAAGQGELPLEQTDPGPSGPFSLCFFSLLTRTVDAEL
jgi:putative transposase